MVCAVGQLALLGVLWLQAIGAGEFGPGPDFYGFDPLLILKLSESGPGSKFSAACRHSTVSRAIYQLANCTCIPSHFFPFYLERLQSTHAIHQVSKPAAVQWLARLLASSTCSHSPRFKRMAARWYTAVAASLHACRMAEVFFARVLIRGADRTCRCAVLSLAAGTAAADDAEDAPSSIPRGRPCRRRSHS